MDRVAPGVQVGLTHWRSWAGELSRGTWHVKIFETADIRNFVLAGHSGSGKTTLAEAMLFSAGAINRQGRVSEGTSTLDFTPEEQKKHTGVSLALAQFEFGGKKFNQLDAPGYVDFFGEVHAGIAAADFGVVVISAVAGVEPDTERVFELMETEGMPGSWPSTAWTVIRPTSRRRSRASGAPERPGGAALFPHRVRRGLFRARRRAGRQGAALRRQGRRRGPVPAELQTAVEEARGKLVELAAESDDAYLEKYLDTLELSPEETVAGLRKGIAQGKIYPVIPVSGEKARGASVLLRLLADFGPSPKDVAGVPVTRPGSAEPQRLPADPAGPLAAQIFKVSSDLTAQEMALLRVFSGSIASGSDVYNSSHDNSERVGQLYHFLGRERSDADRLVAGIWERSRSSRRRGSTRR